MTSKIMQWRTGDLLRTVPIRRDDLNQAISRDGFRPEHMPEPGKDRWYSWRDVVAIAAAQELRMIGHGPKTAFGLVQEHLSPFLCSSADQPGDCEGVIWLIHPFEDGPGRRSRCEFVQHTNDALLIASGKSACIIVNVGRIAQRILDELKVSESDK